MIPHENLPRGEQSTDGTCTLESLQALWGVMWKYNPNPSGGDFLETLTSMIQVLTRQYIGVDEKKLDEVLQYLLQEILPKLLEVDLAEHQEVLGNEVLKHWLTNFTLDAPLTSKLLTHSNLSAEFYQFVAKKKLAEKDLTLFLSCLKKPNKNIPADLLLQFHNLPGGQELHAYLATQPNLPVNVIENLWDKILDEKTKLNPDLSEDAKISFFSYEYPLSELTLREIMKHDKVPLEVLQGIRRHTPPGTIRGYLFVAIQNPLLWEIITPHTLHPFTVGEKLVLIQRDDVPELVRNALLADPSPAVVRVAKKRFQF